ncbi:hypothetical protein BDA99DRAFT_522515 [Phascolomyces articulosus]|uniref:Uncharacterized protein n=1 Tax=Phascolomyces articulosus TaxID=60185 RepID=A0AAD5P9T7_9FUNG|nr:hypothetical protein BDA99DRAFT_522515 [Phascolomyces articulosus]
MFFVVTSTFLSFFQSISYAIFLWETKVNHFTNYYYVWLPAIASWIHNGICLYYHIEAGREGFRHDEKILLDHSLVQITLYLKAIVILFAFWKFHRSLTNKSSFSTTTTRQQQQKHVITTLSIRHLLDPVRKYIYISASILSIGGVYYFGVRTTLDYPFPTLNTLLMVHCGHCFGLLYARLITKWCASSSSAESMKTASYQIYQCFISLLPFYTIYEAIILVFRNVLFPIPWLELPLTIVSCHIFILELFLTDSILIKKAYWPDLDEDNCVSKRKGYVNIA